MKTNEFYVAKKMSFVSVCVCVCKVNFIPKESHLSSDRDRKWTYRINQQLWYYYYCY